MLTVLAAYWPWIAIAALMLGCTGWVERRAR